MKPLHSILAGLTIPALITLSLTGPPQAQERQLCTNGKPSHRSADVTYGGLRPKYGYQRDHRIPLCLGGEDTPANVRYQPLSEARIKDHEERQLCDMLCAGKISLSTAQQKILADWP